MTTKPLTKKQIKAQERAEAVEQLRKCLNPGDKVYCILRRVSRSGMRRRIDLYTFKDGDRVYLSGYAARAMDDRLSEQGGIIVDGCGMDMGFSLVYNLGRTLFPKGFVNTGHGRNGSKPGSQDNDGGYALKHEWL
jgi:hypothetical protein